MRTFLTGLAAALLLGCAARTTKTCQPVSPELIALAGQPVFPRCAVDRPAAPATVPRSQFTPRQNCGSATIAFVVDPEGRPLPGTARVVRATDRTLAEVMIAELEQLRFRPALKDSIPVAQLDELTRGYQVGVASTRTPTSVSRANAPNC